jgi:5-methylcytosine-specific restriction endonuclease McrA
MITHITDSIKGKHSFFKRRSRHWRRTRNEFIKKNPGCIVCNTKKKLEVHHIKMFSDHPHLELSHNNLATMCRRCHRLFGHLDNYRVANPDVKYDAWVFNKKIKERGLNE